MVCQYFVYVSVPYFMSPRSSEDCARKTVQMPAAEAEVQGFRTSHRLTSAECRYLVGSFCDEYTVYPHSTFDLIWLDHDTWWILTPNWIMIWDLSPNSLSLSLALPHGISRHLASSRVTYYSSLPSEPHKAVAEVSKIGHYRRGELLSCMDGRANPLMDRKVVRVVFFGLLAMVAVVTSPTFAGCSVAWCSCSCSCNVVIVMEL